MPTTKTKRNEHWDQIALRVYGAEKHMDFLLQQNPELAHIYRFAEGTVVRTPPMPENVSNVPSWRA